MEAMAATATAPPSWWDNPAAYIVATVAVISLVVAIIGLAIAVTVRLVRIGRWIGGVEGLKSTVDERIAPAMDELRKEMTEIRDQITGIFMRLGPATVSTASPVQLTDLGKAVSKEIEAESWAREAVPTLADRAGKLSEEFEFHELAETYVQEVREGSEVPKELERRVKACAYAKGIELEQVWRVLVVELRDALLSLRKE